MSLNEALRSTLSRTYYFSASLAASAAVAELARGNTGGALAQAVLGLASSLAGMCSAPVTT